MRLGLRLGLGLGLGVSPYIALTLTSAAHSNSAAARGLWVEGSPGARGLKRYQPEQQIGSPYLRVGGSVSLSRA